MTAGLANKQGRAAEAWRAAGMLDAMRLQQRV
jgi:hypothetical protein